MATKLHALLGVSPVFITPRGDLGFALNGVWAGGASTVKPTAIFAHHRRPPARQSRAFALRATEAMQARAERDADSHWIAILVVVLPLVVIRKVLDQFG